MIVFGIKNYVHLVYNMKLPLYEYSDFKFNMNWTNSSTDSIDIIKTTYNGILAVMLYGQKGKYND